MRGFEKFKQELLSKEKFYTFLTGKSNSDRNYRKVWEKFKIEIMKDYHNLYLYFIIS